MDSIIRPTLSSTRLSFGEMSSIKHTNVISSTLSELPNYTEFWDSTIQKIRNMGYDVSPSQPSTAPDGNCLFGACSDQMNMTGRALRARVCDELPNMISSGSMYWPYGDAFTPAQWAENMKKNGTFGDEIALQVIRYSHIFLGYNL